MQRIWNVIARNEAACVSDIREFDTVSDKKYTPDFFVAQIASFLAMTSAP